MKARRLSSRLATHTHTGIKAIAAPWATRTKLIALQLINFAKSKNVDFSVYCDKYDKILNEANYDVSGGRVSAMFSDYRCLDQQYPCFNHVCTLEYGGNIAFGISLNSPIDDSTDSFLLTMNASPDLCDAVPLTSTNFRRCGSSDFFYNPSIESIIYAPAAQVTAIPYVDFAAANTQIIKPELDTIKDYVENEYNLPFFSHTPLFNRIYYSETGNKKVFSFLEIDQTFAYHNYFGVNYQGYSFGSYPCTDLFEYSESIDGDLDIYCDNQPSSNDFILIGVKTLGSPDGMIDLWQDLSSKLRP